MEPTIQDIGRYIEQHAGIKPDAVGPGSWLRAIRKRITVTGVASPRAYQQRVISQPIELQELLELVIVPETWFFRDRAALDFLGTYVKAKTEAGHQPWNILSLACSTGEEAYSIAMALFDIGLPLTAFNIEGVDISKKAIEVARKASYGSNSFRNKATLMHKGNFDKVDDNYVVHEHLKKRVKFFYANITSPNFAYGRRRYDIIFCRNVLIYFGTAVQNQVFDLCEQLLEENGLLVFGPTESELARLAGFVSVGPRTACAFHRRVKNRVSPRDAFTAKGIELHTPQALSLPVSPVVSDRAKKDFFRRAALMADEGQLPEAIEQCKKYLEKFDGDGEIYYLLGTLHIASRNDELAAYYLEKALYLAPDHYDTLVSLALIYQRSGDKERSELFWRRARKQFAMVEEQQQGGE